MRTTPPLVFSPLQWLLDLAIVVWTTVELVVARPPARDPLAEVERSRRGLNQMTAEALKRRPLAPRAVPDRDVEAFHSLHLRQIEAEDELRRLLDANRIRAEQGTRAAATSALFQIALLLKLVELRTWNLTFIVIDDEERRRTYETLMRAADGDLVKAGEVSAAVYRRYLAKLKSRALRRERLARRLASLVRRDVRRAFERDPGVNDIRQQLASYRSLAREHRASLRLSHTDFLTGCLQLMVSWADEDDATFVQHLTDVARDAISQRVEPADRNYPVLIRRLREVREVFIELPASPWMLRWSAHLAMLQAWLYLFAAQGAADASDHDGSRELRQMAAEPTSRATALINECALLKGPWKPIAIRIGSLGRQRQINGYPTPPTLDDLVEMLDKLQARVDESADTYSGRSPGTGGDDDADGEDRPD